MQLIINLNLIKYMIYIIVYLPALISIYVGFYSISISTSTVNNHFRDFLKKLSIFGMFIVCVFSYTLLYIFLKKGHKFNFWFEGASWIKFSNMFDIHWSFNYDFTTAIMFIVVSTISFLVHCYSLDYMKNDINILRFLSYLSLFTFFMLLLVSSANLVQLFIGWEGVGICSYLLINFWYTRVQANKAALKAVLVNKIGDCAFIFALGLIYNSVYSFDIEVVIAKLMLLTDKTIFFLFWDINLVGVICFFLFLAAMAKSALFGFHTWLPDAMEGPTPVSALLHAATMVVAGVYLLIRLGFLFNIAPTFILNFVAFIGGMTCIFGASVALVQYDIKKIIAYSTTSQLGYMILSCSLGHYTVALFHLTTHAFFKALLFLGAGVIIHFLNDEQDLRKMGGLANYMPATFIYMLVGSLALIGFPFLSGFYSKELILELAYINYSGRGFFAYWIGLISAIFTSFYSIRLLYCVFFGGVSSTLKTRYLRFLGVAKSGDANSLYTDIPLFVLAFGSIFVGKLTQKIFINYSIYNGFGSYYWMEVKLHSIIWYIKDLPFFLSILAVIFFLILNEYSKAFLKFFYFFWSPFALEIHNFLLQKWYMDSIYNTFFVFPLFKYAYYYAYLNLDKGWLEFFGPSGISFIIQRIIVLTNKFQTGHIYHYVFVMIFALTFFLGLLEYFYFTNSLNILNSNTLVYFFNLYKFEVTNFYYANGTFHPDFISYFHFLDKVVLVDNDFQIELLTFMLSVIVNELTIKEVFYLLSYFLFSLN